MLHSSLMILYIVDSPLMLSWVIGSRSMLSPRILLALFVRHLSPFYNIRFIKNHSIKLDLQFCHVLCVEPRHHFLRERRVNRSNPGTNFYKNIVLIRDARNFKKAREKLRIFGLKKGGGPSHSHSIVFQLCGPIHYQF